MKGIKLEEPRNVDCVELEKPVPGPGEALIRIVTAGICGSDIGAFRGTNTHSVTELVCIPFFLELSECDKLFCFCKWFSRY